MSDIPISPECSRGDHHACRPDIAACACPCGRNAHPSDERDDESFLAEQHSARTLDFHESADSPPGQWEQFELEIKGHYAEEMA